MKDVDFRPNNSADVAADVTNGCQMMSYSHLENDLNMKAPVPEENACTRVSFLIKLQASATASDYSKEHLWMATSLGQVPNWHSTMINFKFTRKLFKATSKKFPFTFQMPLETFAWKGNFSLIKNTFAFIPV